VQERLPVEEGWKRPGTRANFISMNFLMAEIAFATRNRSKDVFKEKEL